ncbi:cation diffusion facilitator family transporter [Jatrophihabitans lederbergiae]|uniref:Cation diffusion facilitator family transporter n=1 Tax=Jatrophihabitans lederbergiae TaxID=3075547 RepID=A0ABU2JFZ0_9ACTN|nr:cation diffusion facilitator family transporter [Jatrophihabitans sp. DSM 44399]MDT0263905.1 cation diffusion facilitator family transporter [Jatrophihabitans sp. DSM 44399]
MSHLRTSDGVRPEAGIVDVHQHDAHDHDHDHDHDAHDHEHGASVRTRIVHEVSEFLGGHSHDAADQIDDALEADATGRRALWISLAVLATTAALQFVVVLFSGSVALLGDTAHNFADAATAFPLLASFALSRRAATSRYSYGYGRSEDLAGLFVVAAIFASSAFAGYEAIDRLLHPRDVTHLWAVAAAAVVGFAGNELVAQYRIRVGRRIGSAALVADGLHARTDGFTSLAVLVGALGVALGWKQADPIIGLLITVAILGVLRSAVRHVGTRLMDGVDPGLVDTARDAVSDVDDVVNVADLKIRWIGHTLRAEVDLDVTPDLTLLQAHELAHHAEAHLLARLPRLTAVTIHTSPAGAHPRGGATAPPDPL